MIKGISVFFFLHLFILKYRQYLQHCPHIPPLLCEVKCVEVSGAGCWTPRSAAGVECCVHSRSRFGACSVRRSECLECAVLSSWWPLQGTRAGQTEAPVRLHHVGSKVSNIRLKAAKPNSFPTWDVHFAATKASTQRTSQPRGTLGNIPRQKNRYYLWSE